MPTRYREDFIKRVIEARGEKTHAEIAAALQVAPNTYSKYEAGGRPEEGKRLTLLPHHLIWPFCQATGVSLMWLLAGVGRKHQAEPLQAPTKPQAVRPFRAPLKRVARR